MRRRHQRGAPHRHSRTVCGLSAGTGVSGPRSPRCDSLWRQAVAAGEGDATGADHRLGAGRPRVADDSPPTLPDPAAEAVVTNGNGNAATTAEDVAAPVMGRGGAAVTNDGREENTSDGGNTATTDGDSAVTMISSGSAATTEGDGPATTIGDGYPTLFPAMHLPHTASSGIHDKKTYT